MEESFSIKEIVLEIRAETKRQSEKLAVLEATATANLEQAKKTNGRVTKSEDKIEKLEGFRIQVATYATIGATALSFIINRFL
jgi:hypothetical protein